MPGACVERPNMVTPKGARMGRAPGQQLHNARQAFWVGVRLDQVRGHL